VKLLGEELEKGETLSARQVGRDLAQVVERGPGEGAVWVAFSLGRRRVAWVLPCSLPLSASRSSASASPTGARSTSAEARKRPVNGLVPLATEPIDSDLPLRALDVREISARLGHYRGPAAVAH
jgi:hypothetical protein